MIPIITITIFLVYLNAPVVLAREHGLPLLFAAVVPMLLAVPVAYRVVMRGEPLRFPGLISAETIPSGGTTDYAPEMIHAAARGEPYTCFVGEDSRLPFMTMPDAIEAFVKLADADPARLTRRAYNIKGFSSSTGEIRAEVLRHFPAADIRFEPIPEKQRIVDTWPEDVDDSKARRDWGLSPRHGLAEAFAAYLVPALEAFYAGDVTREIASRKHAADPIRFPPRS